VAKPAERVKGDAILASFSLPLRKRGLSLEPFLRAGVRKLLVQEAGALTWVEGHGTQAPRVVVACVGESGPTRPESGWAGSPTDAECAHQHTTASRHLGAAVEHACNDQGVGHLVLAPLPAEVDLPFFIDGLLARGHTNDEFRPQEAPATLQRLTVCVPRKAVAETRARVDRAIAVAESVALARTLTDLPANIGHPAEIVARVRAMASDVGLRMRHMGAAKIDKLGMGLITAVAQGSAHAPALVTLEHRPDGFENLPTLVLVGKGVVHDTGGYNLKTTPVMHAFTNDKAGAAAVFAAMRAIRRLDLPLHVVGVAALVENALDSRAYKPGDILTAMDGTTVFVESTDAEGRLLLADCLTWVARLNPTLVVDLATLTGASWTALGAPFSALFSNDAAAQKLLQTAGIAAGEPVWPMPIHAAHAGELSHHLAQLRNVGPSEGAACVAAAFLRHFVDYPWAHVDMAGRASSLFDQELIGPGASGYGTRLLVEVACAAAKTWVEGRR